MRACHLTPAAPAPPHNFAEKGLQIAEVATRAPGAAATAKGQASEAARRNTFSDPDDSVTRCSRCGWEAIACKCRDLPLGPPPHSNGAPSLAAPSSSPASSSSQDSNAPTVSVCSEEKDQAKSP